LASLVTACGSRTQTKRSFLSTSTGKPELGGQRCTFSEGDQDDERSRNRHERERSSPPLCWQEEAAPRPRITMPAVNTSNCHLRDPVAGSIIRSRAHATTTSPTISNAMPIIRERLLVSVTRT